MKVDIYAPLEMHPDLDPTKPLPYELTQAKILADVEQAMANAPAAELVLCCERGDLHLVDVSAVRRIYMHPDDIEELKTSVPLLFVSSTAPPGLFTWSGIDILKNGMIPRGMMAFDPPARRLKEVP